MINRPDKATPPTKMEVEFAIRDCYAVNDKVRYDAADMIRTHIRNLEQENRILRDAAVKAASTAPYIVVKDATKICDESVNECIDFLHGRTPFKGIWYGRPKNGACYWWRKEVLPIIESALSELETLRNRCKDQGALIDRLRRLMQEDN